jgi:hypothetical protein
MCYKSDTSITEKPVNGRQVIFLIGKRLWSLSCEPDSFSGNANKLKTMLPGVA